MRDCDTLLEELKKEHEEQFNFIRKKALEINNDEYTYFLGIRNNYLSLYYKGMCMAKIRIPQNSSRVTYSTHNYYVFGKKSSNYKRMNLEDFCGSFNCIKKNIKTHVSGIHDKRKKLEKICQQWIINKNNADPDSEWYFLDMEYVLDSSPFGRVDMIAIKRNPNVHKKHEVALIELKIGNNSYKGLNSAQYHKFEEEYNLLKNNLYHEDASYNRLKFGSGLIGHITEFMRLLHEENHYSQIKDELVQIISAYKKLGLINCQHNLYNIEKGQLAEKPDVYILSYAYVPNLEAEDIEKTTLSSMKCSFYNYLYSSTYCLHKMINESQIDGILKMEKDFKIMKEDDKINILECQQHIGEQDYNFIFQFIDPDELPNPWRCLK